MQCPMRMRMLKAISVCILLISSLVATAQEAGRYQFNIESQNVAQALRELANATGNQLLFPYDLVEALESNAVSGRYTLEDALMIMLDGTSLSGQLTNDGVILVTPTGKKSDDEGDKMYNKNNSRKSLLAGVAAFLASMVTTQSVVGEVTENKVDRGAVAKASEMGMVEEVIVTAQKRSESIQDVPIAMTALSGDALAARGIESVLDLSSFSPGLTVGATSLGQAQVTIRGVGAENITVSGDPGVAVHIDGHYVQSSSYALRDFMDIERVEVLRGPQGTLYGRNATGGSINIITKRPSDEFELSGFMDIGNYDRRLFQGVVSGPLSDNLKARLAVSNETRDGYTKNISGTGRDDFDDSDYISLRSSIVFQPDDSVDIFASAYYYKDTSIQLGWRTADPYPQDPLFGGLTVNPYLALGAGTNPSVSDPWTVSLNSAGDGEDKAVGGSIDIDWDLGSVLVRSLSAYNHTEQINQNDTDGSSAVSWEERDQTINKTYTQELQLLSNNDGPLGWIIGLFFYREDSTWNNDLVLDNLFDPVAGPQTRFALTPAEVEATSYAAFGQLNYAFNSQFELIAGLRYSYDDKRYAQALIVDLDGTLLGGSGIPIGSLPDAPFNTEVDVNWDELTYKLGLNYTPTDDVLFYASYATGYKPGGFFAGVPYDPEMVKSFEAGVKSQWFDGRVSFNASAYYYDYKDQQLTRRDFIFVQIINADASTIKGLEFETQAVLSENMSVDASFAYTDAKIDDFDTLDGAFPGLGIQSLDGNRLPRAPKYQLHFGAQYQWSLGEMGSLKGRVDTSWTGEQFYRVFNANIDDQSSYFRTNARLSWTSVDERWSADLYVYNLENNNIRANQFVSAPIVANVVHSQYLPPRTYGLRLGFHW